MRLPGEKIARRSGQWVLGRLVSHAVILGYHRVSDGADPYRLSVAPERFAEQLAVLARTTSPVHLEELPGLLAAGRVPKRTVALTFDDGYADVLHLAKPLLAQFGIPATVFVISGALGRELWWDRLDRLVTTAGTSDRRLALPIGDTVFIWPQNGTSSEEALRGALYPKLRTLDPRAREAVLDELAELMGVPAEVEAGEVSRVVTTDELRQLGEGDLVHIGAHTVTHPALSELTAERQREEIAGSRRDLEAALGHEIKGFSYPFGDTGAAAPNMVHETGFDYACESRSAIAWRRTNRFALPRFWAPDWDGERFAGWLERWLDD